MAQMVNPDNISDSTRQALGEYQQLLQQLQMFSGQRQQLMISLEDIKQATTALDKSTGTVYRTAGNVLVPRKKDELKKELADEAETLEMRKTTFQKQEEKLRAKLAELEKKLQAELGSPVAK